MTLQELYNELKQLIDSGIDPNLPVIIDMSEDNNRYYALGHFGIRGSANRVQFDCQEIVISD